MKFKGIGRRVLGFHIAFYATIFYEHAEWAETRHLTFENLDSHLTIKVMAVLHTLKAMDLLCEGWGYARAHERDDLDPPNWSIGCLLTLYGSTVHPAHWLRALHACGSQTRKLKRSLMLLVRCSLPIASCRGQAYDKASNMSGIRNEVQALVKRETDRALYVHCFAHSLNLCVQEVSKGIELIRNVMDFIYELVQLIKFSPKRTTIFSTLKKEVSVTGSDQTPSQSLRTLCSTR